MLVGRERECARIDDLLARARAGRAGGLVIRGEAGIGKTALLDYAAEVAAEGMTVVRGLGIESEAELEFSGLLEVCRRLMDSADELPVGQAEALRGALGLGPPEPVERFTIGAATLNLLAAASERRPLAVIVDDAQWLDQASADALLFAARRLDADAVALVFGSRDDDRALDAAGLEELVVTGIGRNAAIELLESGGATVAPSLVARLHEATGGNPLALLELPRLLTAAQLAGEETLDEPLPTAAALEDAFVQRVEGLPHVSRRALLIASIVASSDVEAVIAALVAAGVDPAGLEAAEDIGLISVGDGRLEFRHPLVRSAVHQAARPSERRAAHRAAADALAGVPGASDRRAWHLGAATLGPDESVAAELEVVGREAIERTGYAAGAAALERAARLSPDDRLRGRRLFEAARAAWHAGESSRALALLERPPLDRPEPAARSAVAYLRSQIEFFAGEIEPAAAALREAATLVESEDPKQAVQILVSASEVSLYGGDIAGGLEVARRARALAARDGGGADCLVDLALGEALILSTELEEGSERLERGIQLVGESALRRDARCLTRASMALGWLDRWDEARVLAGRAVDLARERGGTGLLPYALEVAAWHDVRLGFWQSAYSQSLESSALAVETGQPNMVAHCLRHMAVIDAARGHEETCRRRVEEAVAMAKRTGLRPLRLRVQCVLGLLDLGLGRSEQAIEPLDEARREIESLGLYEREASPWGDLVEAYVRVGETDKARETLAQFEATRLRTSPVWPHAVAAHCRGLLAPDDRFEREFEEALALHGRLGNPFAVARTRLCYGERLRRDGRRTEAREQLRPAIVTFDELGATPWGDRARSELRASGETARRRDVFAAEELTPQELQVASHVAEGKTNREVGAALFLSHKTVESHLARVYRKLGINSRSELIRLFATRPQDLGAAIR